LGLGNFFRAHQAWYTQHAGDGDQWGIAAFTGLTGQVADTLSAQDCLYTLDVRSPDGDEYEPIESLAAVQDADDRAAWLRYWADPAVQYLTLTVTEAGYRRNRSVQGDRGRDQGPPRGSCSLTPPQRKPFGSLPAGLSGIRVTSPPPLSETGVALLLEALT
jgi:fructuronate reductase